MPTASLPGGPAFEAPPRTLRKVSEDLYEYLYLLHTRLFGLAGSGGDLDDINISGLAHAKTTGVSPYQHHGSDAHGDIIQATAIANITAAPVAVSTTPVVSTVAITTADADLTYDANEQALLNELKADVGTLVADLNATITTLTAVRTDAVAALTAAANAIVQVNALLAALRTAKVLAP